MVGGDTLNVYAGDGCHKALNRFRRPFAAELRFGAVGEPCGPVVTIAYQGRPESTFVGILGALWRVLLRIVGQEVPFWEYWERFPAYSFRIAEGTNHRQDAGLHRIW